MKTFAKLACILLLLSLCTGCTSTDGNKVHYDIVTGNDTPYDIILIIYIDGDVGMGEGSSAYTVSKGNHDFKAEAYDENEVLLDEATARADIKNQFTIDVLFSKDGLRLKIEQEKKLPPRSDNNAPELSEGKYTLLENGTYRFSVNYTDLDGDEPWIARMLIVHYYDDGWGNNLVKYSIYELNHTAGSYKTGATYDMLADEFSEGDEYRFMFSDGYDQAIPADGTPCQDT